MSDRQTARGLPAGLSALRPKIGAVIVDAGQESEGLARDLRERNGERLVIVERKDQAFRIDTLMR